jgi:dienelactone hydrolase
MSGTATAPRPCPEAPDFEEFHFSTTFDCKLVLKIGQGPGVILMHELPGTTPQCLRLARLVSDAGFTVYLPLLLGRPNEHAIGKNLLRLCISREFRIWATNKDSPVVDWLRGLGCYVNAHHPGRGIGVVGMCLTGGFALAMVADRYVVASAVCQPSLPLAVTSSQKSALGISRKVLQDVQANGNARIIAMRFDKDRISPPERMQALEKQLRGQVSCHVLPADLPGLSAYPHAVLTEELQVHDDRHRTMQALEKIIALFRNQLR